MVRSPRWIRRAALTGAVLAAVATALPAPNPSPSAQLGTSAPAGQPSTADTAIARPSADAGTPSSVEPSLEGYAPAQPAAAPEPAKPVVSAPGGATPVRLTRNDPACGVGLTLVEVQGGDVPASCVHNVLDPVPGRGPNQGAVRMQPVCHGDGVSGPRIQFLYVYAEGQPNKAAEYVPHMLNSWIPAMEGSFRTTSRSQGREIGMRVHMPKCKIDIGVVRISADDAEPDDPGAMRGRIERAVRAAGYTQSGRKYHAWFDGANKGACGVAPVIPTRGLGDNPTPLNPNNLGSTPMVNVMPQVAVTFKLPFALPAGLPDPGPICWGNGGMGALTEIHELLHLLGSVSFSAPNSNGLGHCRDEEDIMCYSEGGVQTFRRCATEIEALDCGSDDYFNARPQVGSYLSYNWNVANSKFLGSALEDLIPITLPRP